MQKKYRGIRRFFNTKGQHNDEADLPKSTYGQATSKNRDSDVTAKASIELSIKTSGDSPPLRASKTESHTHEADGKQLSHAHNSPDKENIQSRVQELHSENLALRRKLWRMQYRGTIPTGIILSSIGAASLLLSYLWSSLILTFIGLGITLWGILIIYISPSRHVRAELLNPISSSMQKSLDNLLVTYLGYSGEVIFFHPRSLTGLGQGYIFIPHYTAKTEGNLNSEIEALNLLPQSSEGTIPSVYLDPKGIFLAAPSQGLVDLFEKELGVNFATVPLVNIQQIIPKLLVEDLKIVDELQIEQNDDTVAIRANGGPCIEMCRTVKSETRLGNHLGCPLCSALALVVSKVSGKPVMIKETTITEDNKSIHSKYTIINQQSNQAATKV